MLSLLVRFALASGLGSSVPYITFFPAIMLSAWYGGLGPGLLITGLSAVAALYLFLAPLSLRITNNTDLIGLIVFLAVGAVISCLNEALHQAHCRVESELLARRESEDALAESEEQYRVMTEAASDGIITIDAHSTILLANNAAARIFGYTGGELVGQPLTMLMPEYLRHVHETSLRRYVETGEKHLDWRGVELPGLHKNGREITLEVSFGEYRKDLQHVFTGVIRDITERKQFDEQLRHVAKLESLGVLAGGVAHDFNNLLTGILGNASLASEMVAPENPARQMMRDVVEGSERAAQLTRQLLAYAGKGRFVIEPLNLSALVRQISNLIRTSIPKNVQLRLDVADDLPPISGDASQLQQVVMNLVINGAEAIPAEEAGTVLVRTRVQHVDEAYIRSTVLSEHISPGQYVLLEVHDTGAGMAPDIMDRIFDPFFTTKFTGRGLGLAAVLGIVRSHKGALKVYSTRGQGSTFKTLFPITGGVTGAAPAQAARSERRITGLILVVDDEAIVRKAAQAALERYGLTVVLAENGTAAIGLYRNRAAEIAAVVLDLTMPGVSGEETLRQLRSIRSNVKVILSSGYNEVEVINRFIGKGLAGFIQKPYTAMALADSVAAVLMPPDLNPNARK